MAAWRRSINGWHREHGGGVSLGVTAKKKKINRHRGVVMASLVARNKRRRRGAIKAYGVMAHGGVRK